MKGTQRTIFIAALLCIVAAAGFLLHAKHNQRMGPPGVKTSATADPKRLHVDLPTNVLDYTSIEVETDKLVLDFLPKDTSFGQRRYVGPDGFETLVNVVLMGTDRTSLHKPQFCLAGSGWNIDDTTSLEDKVSISRPAPYDLPVMKLIASKRVTLNGREYDARGIYAYWFVCHKGYTAQHWQRMWWMAKDLLTTGVLDRWAYVTCFSVCAPGQEDATYERMKRFMNEAVPQFQLFPKSAAEVASAFGPSR